jgi:HSP20 family protein
MITTRTTSAYPLSGTLERMGTLNRVLDQMLPDGLRAAAPAWVPPLEVAERADAYLIAADLPGVREDQLEIGFENNVLTVRGNKPSTFAAANEGTLRVHVAERQTGTFERSVRLPEYVEGDRIEARLLDGVLQVTVPKSPAAQPRKISVSRESQAPRVEGGETPNA